MKTLLYFTLIGLLLGVGACKKENATDSCLGVVCQNGGVCVNGVCVCDTGYSGVHCEVLDSCYNTICGAHGHCVSGVCNCDSGWTGSLCQIRVSSINDSTSSVVAGSYRVSGESGCWNPSGVSSVPIIDTTIYILDITDSAAITSNVISYNVHYQTSYSDTSIVYYSGYSNTGPPYEFCEVKFFKNFPDSIYLHKSLQSGVSNGCYKTFYGMKIH